MTKRKDYDSAANSAGSYAAGIEAIRFEGVKAGRFLPLPDRPKEIKASPLVQDVRRIGPCTLYLGDCTKITPLLEGLDACVTDPPYELGFMGKSWDSTGVAAAWETWGGVRIALKPGAHLVAFAGSRTYHRITKAIDDAGFEVRDQLLWIYGSGFPKSLDISKAIAAKEQTGKGNPEGMRRARQGDGYQPSGRGRRNYDHGAGSVMDAPSINNNEGLSHSAERWKGWGTALKPAHEPVCFARKPLSEGTVAANVLRWATGAINIDGARIESGADHAAKCASVVGLASSRSVSAYGEFKAPRSDSYSDAGRWPANVLTDGSLEVLEAFPPSARDAVRFFYAAKADKAEREFGLEDAPKRTGGMRSNTSGQHITRRDGGAPGPRANTHPTVKPVDLMRWLCRLVTPPAGTVLDPFMGSGSTGIAAVREGFGFVGCEQSPEYFDIACQRIQAAVDFVAREPDLVREIANAVDRKKKSEQGVLL